MKKICLLFSHTLTDAQKEDISNSLKVEKSYKLPSKLQEQWSQVPAKKGLDFMEYLLPIKEFLEETLEKGDYLLIQGEFGATYHMVEYAKSRAYIPVYSVNERVSREYIEEGIVKKYAEFKHEFFREYK